MQVQKISTSNQCYIGKARNNPSFGRLWEEHISWGANYIKQNGKTNFKLFTFPDAKAVFVEIANKAVKNIDRIKDRMLNVILPAAGAGVVISSLDKNSKVYEMKNQGEGIFTAEDINATPDDSYRYIILTKDDKINIVKDPYAKKQNNIHGWSSIYDQGKYEWKNTDWLEGKDPRRITRKPGEVHRGLDKLIIDEVNIPTLSAEGTFDEAKSRIDEIVKRNVATAIEIMPVENTFSKQWGYDGADKFAVNEQLGGPDKLKEFIDYAHGKGLNVIIDMVPNHMGIEGNYLEQTGPYIKGRSEFGDLFNYEGKDNKYVRDWMTNAALWWANEFKVDGIRFDLTSLVESDWLLRQIVVEMNEHNPDVFLIAEDHRNKMHSVTNYYFNENSNHLQELDFIDSQIDYITKGWKNAPWSIGFDSEWDSQYKDTLSKLIILPDENLLDIFDNLIKTSDYRVKYGYSHDEIGNWDGTRFISKYLVRSLGLFNIIKGKDDSEKGQKAAHAAQKLAELIVSKDFEHMQFDELSQAETKIGLTDYIGKTTLIDTFKTAIAKQKLILGTTFTTPGPKMFFQGDDEGELSYFKFFREFSDEKAERRKNPTIVSNKIKEKGYDPLEEIARPDSIIGKVRPEGIFKDLKEHMIAYCSDLKGILDKYPGIAEGSIVETFKDCNHNVHIHKIAHKNDEFLVIKNFGSGFHNNSYSYYGFPDNSTWCEIFSGDDIKYGGMGYVNKNRTDITNENQNLSLAPNSLIILKRNA